MAKGIKLKNADGSFTPAFILSQINDNSSGKATTYSSEKINELLSDKQDKLSTEQINNISDVPNKIDKTAVGSGLKFADGKLQLDIPVATADTGYGG